MAEWHLHALEDELRKRGWLIDEVRDGDDHRVSATWEMVRGESRILLDFDGFDDMTTLPLAEAYGVGVGGTEGASLYFGKKPTEARPNRKWNDELAAFVEAIDKLGA